MRPIEHFIVALFSSAPIFSFGPGDSRHSNSAASRLSAVSFPTSLINHLHSSYSCYRQDGSSCTHCRLRSRYGSLCLRMAGRRIGCGGIVFVIAHASHLLADNYVPLASGRVPSDLLWPLLPPVARPAVPYWAGPMSINIHLFTAFSVAVLTLTAYYLISDIKQQRQPDL